MTERTLGIIKPSACRRSRDAGDTAIVGEVADRIFDAGLRVIGASNITLDKLDAEAFYAPLRSQPYFNDAVAELCSGPCFAMLIEGPDAVAKWRKLIGNTLNPAEGTLRHKYRGELASDNAFHGSSSKDEASRECKAIYPAIMLEELKQIAEQAKQNSRSYDSTVKKMRTPYDSPFDVDAIIEKISDLSEVKVQLGPGATMPSKATEGAAGLDIHASHGCEIWPGDTVAVPTGLFMAIPRGYEAQVRSRSGLAFKGITVANSPGTIDSDYRGEIKVLLHNESRSRSVFAIKPGDRIAQLVFARVPELKLKEVEELDSTARGDGGFGSTGVEKKPRVGCSISTCLDCDCGKLDRKG